MTQASPEVQEAALTGESVPVAKDVAPLDADVALGDRFCMTNQNTFVTRGTARIIVTATGTATEVGQIAGMLGDVERICPPSSCRSSRPEPVSWPTPM